ncbi:elongation factor Tu GTP binding domain-containing protein [Lineolata rhizophorae]|uniref:Elongation factor 1-alpha n=1 Tax=Lineolata rhizophorae TaxID=578093 RepID=A0A6A6NPW5_9PEZI|nr:elongation factor Tu GTP binding domain-containing protein [Lineolata rhizophorae]
MADLNSWEDDKDAQDDSLAQQTQQSLNFSPQAGGPNPAASAFRPGASSFQPGAQSFQPQQFQQYGGYGQFQQYGGYGQQGGYGYQQYGGGGGQGGYPQYGGQGGFPQYGQQYGGYGQQQYGGYGQQQQRGGGRQQGQGQGQQQQRQVPVIAKRPSEGGDSTPASEKSAAPSGKSTPASGMSTPKSADAKPAPQQQQQQQQQQKAKVLSIGGDSSAKVDTAGKTKVLTLGGDSPKQDPKASGDQSTASVSTSGKTKVLSIGSTGPSPAPSAAKENADKDVPEAGSKVAAAKAIEKTGEPTPGSSGKASGKTSPTPSSGRSSPSRAEQRAMAREADAVAKAQEQDVDEDTLAEMYGKEHVNVIFLGHVDAGKSTLGGSILYATGMVDERTMEKYKKEAKDAGRETWYLSWALDLTKEERSKGKTVEVGRGFFETEKRRYTILDAPGHKTFVPNMIGGASQADMGVLVISARKGEYETGFEKGGQTREHAVLAKTQGVNKLVVVVNKMDDPTVEWSEDRYNECISKLTGFLKSIGYNPKTDIIFMPISAQTTLGIKDRIPDSVCPWYSGPSLLEYLDSMQTLERKVNAPFMMPIAAKYRDMGTMIEGKVESGVIKKGNTYLMMPNRESITITTLYGETEDEIPHATCGDQVRVRIRGCEEEDIMPGFVLCSPKRPVHCVSSFEAQIVLLELKSILSAGFNCVLHVHSATEEVTFAALLHKLEKGTGRKSKRPPGFATKGMSIIARLEVIGGAGSVCVERFEDYPQLGRFTLRDQGQTIAIGKITKLIKDPNAV